MHVINPICVLLLWVHTLTFALIPDCTLQQFLNGPKYDSNFDTSGLQPSYPAGKQIRVACTVGYSGFFKLTCVEGKWESRGTVCQPKSCGHPGDAQFADFNLEVGDDFVFGSKVVYTCHKGYQMVSRTNSRRCMNEGWDGVIPVCEAQQCPVIHVDNNVQVNGDPEEATYGNVVRFSCKSNSYILSDPASAELYCDENGEWSGQPPKCIEIKCAVHQIENGQVSDRDIREYKEHDVLQFRCDVGYKRTEDRPSKCTKVGIRAEWTPTPACEPIKCKLLLTPGEGTRYGSVSRNVFLPGEILRVICEAKYGISNNQESAVTTCNEDGEWSIRPICTEVVCSNRRPQHVDYWGIPYWRNQPYKMGETINYRCERGFKSTDDATLATCTRDGWTPNPLCQEITCDRKDIQEADVIGEYKQRYRYNEQVGYVCREGYQGQFTLTCRENGWIGNPRCTERTCNRKDIPKAEVISEYKQTYRYNEQVGYRCRDGYQGEFTLTCRGDGWTGSPTCREITCNRKDIPKAEVISEYKQTYRYNEQVGYRCRDGYQEQFTLTCGGDGWTGSPTCTEITCDRKDIPKADVIGEYKQRYRYDEQVGYVCREGYQGQFTLTCGENGWIANPRCTEITCDRKNVPKAEVISEYKQTYRYNEQVRYRCREGYQGGEFTLTCGGDGWIGTPTCRDACPKPEVPNGFAVGPYNNTIYYSCNEGFKLFSNNGWWAEAKCNDSRLQLCIENTKCGETPVIPNGKVVPPQRQDLRQIQARITCNTGYRTQVDNLPCREGEWTSNGILLEDICKPTAKLCNPPPKVEYAVVRTSYQKEYLSDSPVTYQCHDGYDIEGEDTILCNDGKWEEKNITCTEITCDRKNVPKAEVISEYKQTYRYNEQVRYRCRDGYQGGEFTLTCGGDGWIGSPTCREITCDRKDIPKADVISEYKQTYRYNEQVGYRCRDGYQGGEFTLTCGGDGWIGTPTCRESVGCGSPPPLTDGDIKYTIKSNYSHQERVEFMCQRYYTMEGGPNRTCISGEWTGQMRCLKPCIVNEDLYRQHNITIKSSDSTFFSHDEIIEFRCARGVPVGAVAMRQRCNGGVILLPTCQ
ncbi:complement factor H-like isoform X9 [Perca fluviatilis]|uniref:complement factor H-like isoform X9 n=1 Tax=Perca fluviatilis TaxID=8168 RepID=UPI0019657D76|nr:complement factor H-like isoform X9 [Perca fluviatilis]